MPYFKVIVTGVIEIEADSIDEAEVIYQDMDMNELDYAYEIERESD